MILIASLAAVISLVSNESEIDLFMRDVLENQKAAQATLTQFIFTEEERLEVRDSRGAVQESRRGSYVWFAREGGLVRSPLTIDGAEVGEGDKLAYEDSWLNGGKKGKRRADIAEDSFFNFSYEPGTYFFAGREESEGRSVVLVEYYPREHFTRTGRDPIGSQGDDFDPAFDKTSLVLFHIDEADKQIARVEFRNIALDYLPSSWLIDVEDFTSSLENRRTEIGAWVPARLELNVVLRQAEGTFFVSVLRTFGEYKRAGVKIDFSVPAEQRIPQQ
jgi:hypothetical protein